MKITKLSLQGFRAFDEPFQLDLGSGKNLLLYGENGSGKSSIYLALNRFFEEQGGDVTIHRNRFAAAARDTTVEIQTQHSDAAGNPVSRTYTWDRYFHPLPVPIDPAGAPITADERSTLVDAARRAGFLDYRSMLRTNLIAAPLNRGNRGPTVHDQIYGTEAEGLGVQLFDLVTLVVLEGVRASLPGGTESTLGQLIRAVFRNRPENRRGRNLERANEHANRFNQAFNGSLPDVQAKLTEFLAYFDNHQLEVDLPQVALAWDQNLNLTGAEFVPEVTFRGEAIADFQAILNEARLSALALCLFLAGVALADNDYDNPNHPRFLLLDDALIGLELQNRLPILKILKSDTFRHHQIFLFTHDRVWYDLARSYLRTDDNWLHKELRADEANDRLVPRVKPGNDDLTVAAHHLQNGDLRAAAVYTRAAFESRLQKVCEKKGIEIKYRRDPHEVATDKLWIAIVARQTKREAKQNEQQQNGQGVSPDFIPRALINDVDVMRSNVLNNLSHANAPALNAVEVGAAIQTVKQLQQHHFQDP